MTADHSCRCNALKLNNGPRVLIHSQILEKSWKIYLKNVAQDRVIIHIENMLKLKKGMFAKSWS